MNPTSIPQSSPKAQYLAHSEAIQAAVRRCLESGWYILGNECREFEQEFSRWLEVPHAFGVANGTDALVIALRALGIGPGDLVFTVSHTAVATVAAIELAGATPVLVDIDPKRFTICPNSLLKALESKEIMAAGKPRAVIAVHLYGQAADLGSLVEITRQRNLALIEDCAQCHGARSQGRMTGTIGDIGTFSFYPTKNLGALGDGGAVATSRPELAERIRLLREYGWKDRYVSAIPGMNSRLDEIQAAILRVFLGALDKSNAQRNRVAALYSASLGNPRVALPATSPENTHVYHQYVVRTSQRDTLRAHLAACGIGALIHYPVPIHLQPAYLNRVALAPGGLPETERAAREVLSLPMFPQLTDAQALAVVDSVNHWNP